MVDVLSDLLSRLHSRGVLFARTGLRAPWGLAFRPEHDVHLHVITRGRCWLRRTGPPLPLRENDVLLLRGHTAYDLVEHPHATTEPFNPANPPPSATEGHTTLLCGAYTFDGAHRSFAWLPELILAHGDDTGGERLRRLLGLLDDEARELGNGSDIVLDRLVDVLLVTALRTWLTQYQSPTGWLRALADPALGPALTAMHTNPRQPWTLAELARHTGMSRSAFAARFTTTIGVPPMTYLTSWRMLLARHHLADPTHSLEHIAHTIGYSTAYAFSTAFRREHGLSPTHWRAQLPLSTTEHSKAKPPPVNDA